MIIGQKEKKMSRFDQDMLQLEQIQLQTGLRGQALKAEIAQRNAQEPEKPMPWHMLKPILWERM